MTLRLYGIDGQHAATILAAPPLAWKVLAHDDPEAMQAPDIQPNIRDRGEEEPGCCLHYFGKLRDVMYSRTVLDAAACPESFC